VVGSRADRRAVEPVRTDQQPPEEHRKSEGPETMTTYGASRQRMAAAVVDARVPAFHAASLACWPSPMHTLGTINGKPARPRRTEVST
jgi:hypothetical protein